MPTSHPVALTGQSFTFTFNGKAGTMQITKSGLEKQRSFSSKPTYGGAVALGGALTTTVKADILYDGSTADSVYAALDAAIEADTAGELKIQQTGGGSWSGQARITQLGVELPADDACTSSVSFAVTGRFPFTAAATTK